jgi:hypothetical protein
MSFPPIANFFVAMNMQLLPTSYDVDAAENAPLPCLQRQAPEWPSSLLVVQRKVPDQDSDADSATTVTYYDSNLGANLIQITPDNSSLPVLWDLELDSGHSYYFYPSTQTCKRMDLPVGILRRDWLKDAVPMGESTSWDGRGQVCGWTKADFIDYYADKETGVPASWHFHTMQATFQVLYYEENPSIDPSLFDPPEYCTQL